MEQILCGQLNAAGFLALLCLAKIITTSLTLGSGGSGGTLFPSMFIGACLGGSFGSVAHSLMPGLVEGSGAYAIVGWVHYSLQQTKRRLLQLSWSWR